MNAPLNSYSRLRQLLLISIQWLRIDVIQGRGCVIPSPAKPDVSNWDSATVVESLRPKHFLHGIYFLRHFQAALVIKLDTVRARFLLRKQN